MTTPAGGVHGSNRVRLTSSKVDQQELDNALNQARKEIENRFDFKNSKTSIDSDGKKITLVPTTSSKCATSSMSSDKGSAPRYRRQSLRHGEVEPAASNTVRQTIALRNGIPKDQSKALLEKIKSLKLKVNAQFQDEQIRVSGKNRDDLQKVIAALKAMEFDLPLQFVNY